MTQVDNSPITAGILQAYKASSTQPFYLIPPVIPGAYFETIKTAALCSALNRLGFESYVVGTLTEGHYWAPLLTSAVSAAHFKSNRKPLVLNASAALHNPLKLGVHVYMGANRANDAAETESDALHRCVVAPLTNDAHPDWCFPLPETDRFCPGEAVRQGALLYVNAYQGLVQPEHLQLPRVEQNFGEKLDQVAEQLSTAQILYLYEWSDLAVLARLSGCAVVFVPNTLNLKVGQPGVSLYGKLGLAWGTDATEVAAALTSVTQFGAAYRAQMQDWQIQLEQLAQTMQLLAHSISIEACWPQETTDTLPTIYSAAVDLAARADRIKWARLHAQYKLWTARSTPREIDAQIYAEHWVAGRTQALTVLIDQRHTSLDDLADTLDSLAAALGQPAQVYIASHAECPDGFFSTETVHWVTFSHSDDLAVLAKMITTEWLVLLRAGTLLSPRALMEWMLAPRMHPQAQLIYADEDVRQSVQEHAYPFFKPDINVELLRCTNYLGDAVLLKTTTWIDLQTPLLEGELYAAALRLLMQAGRSSIGHIDTILFHSSSSVNARSENAEFELATSVMRHHSTPCKLLPLSRWGTWLVQYECKVTHAVSMVIPTGAQTGYLRDLLLGVLRCPDPNLDEILLVCETAQREEVQHVLADIQIDGLRIVTHEQTEYNHAAALNLGVRQARNEHVLIVDDDTEPLHAHWLAPLLGIMAQPDVACVSPRLVAVQGKESKIVGGPVVLGMAGAQGNYCGESQWLDEAGVYSRLQLTQDVSAVAGHCFLLRRSDWSRVNGFDEKTFGLFFPVLDFCLKLGGTGKRHVWTPLVGYMHHGGKTIELLKRNPKQSILLADAELDERTQLHAKWAKELAADPCYNRHLSLLRPYDIEADIVVDWQPRRQDRPRVLAVPLHSGAGQYRVIEPLNALQDAGLAQTSVIMPLANSQHRLLQPLELLRAAPDRLILQHSVDDGQLGLIESFKRVAPHIKIVQMVDDLFGAVPDKHPSRQFQAREGHQRMMRALIQSDRMVVTTQPLVDYYGKYVSDVHIVPNSLAEQWQGLYKTPTPRKKLRVGWVGAAQHRGDLELITDVVRELASEVDWVFMGMCTDDIKPYVKEFYAFVGIAEYPKKMASLDLDIAIAPLEDNIFNRCKSNLRLLEYGAMGWPVVCSDVYPYQTNQPPVLHAKNSKEDWIANIRSLYDFGKRKTYSQRLHQWVQQHYILKNLTAQWQLALFDAELQERANPVDPSPTPAPTATPDAPARLVIISATQLTESDFWTQSALGLSIPRLLAQGESIRADIAFNNKIGLPEIFNTAMARAQLDEILVFIHDDVWIDEPQFTQSVVQGLASFDVIGVAGNVRLLPGQTGWCFVDQQFTWDDRSKLSGRVAHGKQRGGVVSDFGPVPAACEVLDGVFLAAHKKCLMDSGVQFDPHFEFHFYDLDFCRSARNAGLTLGTWPIGLTHQSGGAFGTPSWKSMYLVYAQKWEGAKTPMNLSPKQELQSVTNHIFQLALERLQAGNTGEAVLLLQEIIKTQPQHAAAHFQLGLIAQQSPSTSALPPLERLVRMKVPSVPADPTVQIYQIYYSEATRRSNDPGFLPLDNMENPRPDWREYWPMRQFLGTTVLDENSYYGFFSPKFFEKTHLDANTVIHAIQSHRGEADVFLFSPFFDQGAVYLNSFEQAIDHHQNFTEAVVQSLHLIDPSIKWTQLVMSSDQLVFCNYWVAKPAFWKTWLAVCERLFAVAEQNTTPLAELLNASTNHNGVERAPNKVFVIERIASLLLCTQRSWRVKSFLLADAPYGNPLLQAGAAGLVQLDDYKRTIAMTASPEQIRHFYAMRESLVQHILATEPSQKTMHEPTKSGDEVVDALQQALRNAPHDPVAHDNWGAALVLQQRYQEAKAAFEQAVALDRGFTKAWLNLSLLLELMQQPEQSLSACQSALASGADDAEVHRQMARLFEQAGNLSPARASFYRAKLAGQRCQHAVHSQLLTLLNRDPLVESAHLLQEHVAYGTAFAKPLHTEQMQHCNGKDPIKVLRVGFVLTELTLLERAPFLDPLLGYLTDRPGVVLHAFVDADPLASGLAGWSRHFSSWQLTAALDDAALAQLIRTAQIDILLDLSGHTAGNRLLTFARKPAPVQASWLGYLGTTGVAAIDYYVADPYWLPAEQFQDQFVEKLAFLPSVVTFDAESVAIGSLPALGTSILTFGCLDDPEKINTTVMAVWCMLLRSVPLSRLLLGATSRQRRDELLEHFKQEHIELQRIQFLGNEMSAHDWQHFDAIDICLDTYPSSGVLTTAQAAWRGVPTLCLAGQTAASRFSAALMHQLGLDDFVASGFEELVHIGRYWAAHLDDLAQLRASMRERFAASLLGNRVAFGQAFESMLRDMWQRWCDDAGAAILLAKPHACSLRPGRMQVASATLEKIVVVSASRMSEADFWSQSALGLSLQRLARQGENIQVDIAFENQNGLPVVYNAALARADAGDILAFVHDDVWIDDYQFSALVHAGLQQFDVVGVLGNQRLLPRQPAWCFTDLRFTSDEPRYFSGQISHGTNPFGRLLDFGQVPTACALLDGVFLAVRKKTLLACGVQFDPQFDFQFHDLDFCRSAGQAGLSLGTLPLRLTHQNEGVMGANSWDAKVSDYLNKWEPNSLRVNVRHLNNSTPPSELPLVSIVIPTHNRPDYLEIALQSALAQTYRNIQIVISDNSDDDLTSERLQPYLEANKNIIYFKKTGMSFSDNWKTCLELSSGEYINYLMDDDVFHPEKISRMMHYFTHHPKIGLVTSFRQLINEKGDYIAQKPGMERLYQQDTVVSGRDFGKLMLTNNVNLIGEPTTVLLRRADIGAVFGVFEGRKYIALQDMAVWLSILKDRDFVYISDALSYFRIHSGQDQLESFTQVQGMYEWLRLFLDIQEKKYFFDDATVFHELLAQKMTTFPNYFVAKNQQIRNKNFLQPEILEALNQGFRALLVHQNEGCV